MWTDWQGWRRGFSRAHEKERVLSQWERINAAVIGGACEFPHVRDKLTEEWTPNGAQWVRPRDRRFDLTEATELDKLSLGSTMSLLGFLSRLESTTTTETHMKSPARPPSQGEVRPLPRRSTLGTMTLLFPEDRPRERGQLRTPDQMRLPGNTSHRPVLKIMRPYPFISGQIGTNTLTIGQGIG